MHNTPYTSLPVYKKSLEIRDLSTAIASYFSKESNFFKLKRTGATFINIITRNLNSYCAT